MCQVPEQDGALVGGNPCRRGVYKSDKVVVMVRGGRSLGHCRQRETRAGPPEGLLQRLPGHRKRLAMLVWLRGGGR